MVRLTAKRGAGAAMVRSEIVQVLPDIALPGQGMHADLCTWARSCGGRGTGVARMRAPVRMT